jgi:3-oxoacyl-[acyl-carrier protein] reductase
LRNVNIFQGKVVWVTGSSRGIGASIAKAFAGEGAKVAIHGRDGEALAAVRSDIQGSGFTVMDLVGAVTRFADVEAMRDRIENGFGPIDVLVANAGGNPTPPCPLEETTEDGWRAAIEGNLTATFLTIKSVLPGMKARKAGNIITISSVSAHRPNAKSPIGYAAAKAAIEIMTRDVAAQAGPSNVRANCIAPETILTERNRQRIPAPHQVALASAHPIQRLGTPEDVARAALFLASDAAGWITGIVLDVAGGSV